MMVADRSRQHKVMMEAVQNHTPQVVIVDEIGSKEVRRVQSLGSMHALGVRISGLRVGPTPACAPC